MPPAALALLTRRAWVAPLVHARATAIGGPTRIGDQMLRRSQLECVVAIGFVAWNGRGDRHVEVVVPSSETAAVLIFLDPGDIGEERNRRDVVELQRRVRGIATVPAVRFIGNQLARDIDVRSQLPTR